MNATWKNVLDTRGSLAGSRPTCPSSRASHGLELEYLEGRDLPSAHGLAGLTATGQGYSVGGIEAESYVLNGYRWPQPSGPGSSITITYSIDDSVLGGGLYGVSDATIRAVIREAFAVWAQYVPINFVEVPDNGPNPALGEYDPSGQAMIRFGAAYIDGSSGTLAVTISPIPDSGLAGDVIFDVGEVWSSSPYGGVDLLEVTVHELGHSLGLGHSRTPPAILTPVYQGAYHGPGTAFLYPDDVSGVQSLYGAGTGSVTPLDGAQGRFLVSGGTLYVLGTGGNDTLTFNVDGSALAVSINGEWFVGSRARIQNVIMDGGGGLDTAYLGGWAANEVVWTAPGEVLMTDGFYTLYAGGVEVSSVYTGGGIDTAYMLDSGGNDSFYVAPGVGYMLDWASYQSAVFGHAFIVGIAGRGGLDAAYLYDSAGNDVYAVAPGQAFMSDGFFYLNAAYYFPITGGVATAGGYDAAYFYDSLDNDGFVASGPYSLMSATGYYNLGYGFEAVAAVGSYGYNFYFIDNPAYAFYLFGYWF